MKIRVRQGVIHINSIGYLAKHPDAFVLECDARAKYYDVVTTGGGSDGWYSVVLDKRDGGETLHAEPTEACTVIELWPGGEWWITAHAGRYATLIYAVRRMAEDPSDREDMGLWCDDDTNKRESSKRGGSP